MLSKWAYFFTSSQQDFPGWISSTSTGSPAVVTINKRLITTSVIIDVTTTLL